MEKNEDTPKKETKLQRFNNIISLKGAPYEALLLAIALSLPCNIIIPWAFTAGTQGKWPFCVILIIVWSVLLYETKQLASTFLDMFVTPSSTWKWPCRILGVVVLLLFSPLGIIMIAWLGVKKNRPYAVLLSFANLILFLYAQSMCMGYRPLQWRILLLAIYFNPLLSMASVIILGGLNPLRKKVVPISFAIAVLVGNYRMSTETPLIKQLTEGPTLMEIMLADYREKWPELVGMDEKQWAKATFEYFRKERFIDPQPCDESLLEKEPLKNVISLMQALEKQFVWEQSISNTQVGLQKQYADISKKSAGVRDAIIALAAMPPRPVTRLQPFAESSHPFPKSLAEAARFLAIEMMANAQQRDLVKQDNAAMVSLRDWCLLQESSPFDKAFARRIEEMRLDALARTLSQNHYTEAEWLELLGKEPDWRYFAAYAYKANADCTRSYYDFANILKQNADVSPSHSFCIQWLANSCYCGVNLWINGPATLLKRLFMDPVCKSQKFHMEFISLSLDEKSTMEDAKKLNAIHETYKWPMCVKPGTAFYSMPYYIQDTRQMAMISWKIMEYSHEHQGALPENLAQIGETPISTLNNLPFVYEHGDIEILSDGGDGMINIRGFRLFIPDEEHASKPNWKKADLSMIIPLE